MCDVYSQSDIYSIEYHNTQIAKIEEKPILTNVP